MGDIPIATFDGAASTTLDWVAINDPVMGGKSTSTFSVDSTRGLGVWTGVVAIVPFLQAPGFCNLQSPDLGKTIKVADLSSASGIVLRARETNASGLKHFNVQLMSPGTHRSFVPATYTANVTLSTTMDDHFVAWSAFACQQQGQPVSYCPELTTQLAQINGVVVGTAYPGEPGDFTLELESMRGKSASYTAMV